jgi:flagellar hook-associated protein 1 FlgK
VETQGAAIQGAVSLNEGQQIALKSMEARFAERSGVNIDQEMASLIELQNAYAANARLISAAKEMMDLLLRL